ncbi:MAG TPA: hypothetical protein VLH79_12985 [Chthonomonadales bacterium]|nr:hypothetical protein [Chthonomonadales bacterium]
MYWRLAGTFLVALAVFVVASILLSDFMLGPHMDRTFAFMDSAGPAGSAAEGRYLAENLLPGLLLAGALCYVISAMLAFIVWGCSWSLSRSNRRAWLIGLIAFATLVQAPVLGMSVFGGSMGMTSLIVVVVALLLAFAFGAVPGFVLGQALANRFGAGRGLQRGPVPAP